MNEPASGALSGRRILVTRAANQAAELRGLFEAHGAAVLVIPVIEIGAPLDYGPLDQALREAARYQWVIFTSVNAVERVAARARELALNPFRKLFARAEICAIGPSTRAALEALGCPVALMPGEYIGEGVAVAFAGLPLKGERVLLPRAAVARDVIPEALRAQGAVVDVVEAYRNVPAEKSAAEIANLIEGGEPVDWATFASGSAVSHFLALGGRPLLGNCRVASIGPATSRIAAKHGIRVDAEASEHTASGLVDAIIRFHQSMGAGAGVLP